MSADTSLGLRVKGFYFSYFNQKWNVSADISWTSQHQVSRNSAWRLSKSVIRRDGQIA